LCGDQLNRNWRPKHNPWLIAVVVALAAFMEVLDTSIANVALPHIAGDLAPARMRAMGADHYRWPTPSFCPSPVLSSLMGRKRSS